MILIAQALLYPKDGYGGLITDALEQMASRNLAARSDGHWDLTPTLREQLGKPVVVIPPRKGIRSKHTITLYPKAERERLSKAAIKERELQGIKTDLFRELSVMHSHLRSDRTYEVAIIGPRGKKETRRLRLHPVAFAFPPMTEDMFLALGKDMSEHGAKVPIQLFQGQVLDGRHRVAVASVLHIPLKVEEFIGDDIAARDHVVSLNFMRRDLSIAHRALIVQELYLPQAEAEAKERELAGLVTLSPTGDRVSVKATMIAADRSQGLASARTLQRMEPVREAPKTQERIRNGEITNALAARREALKELGKTAAPTDVPGAYSESSWTAYREAFRRIEVGTKAMEKGQPGTHPLADFLTLFTDMRSALVRAESVAKRVAPAP